MRKKDFKIFTNQVNEKRITQKKDKINIKKKNTSVNKSHTVRFEK